MRRAACVFLGLLAGVALAVAPAGRSQEGKPPDKAPKGNEPAHSKLYRGFGPESLLKTCQAHFGRVRRHGSRQGFRFGDAPDRYKLFDAEGTMSLEQLAKLLAALKAELHKRAKASGVEKVGEPSDKIEDRPLRVMRHLYYGRLIKPTSARGFYLTYTEGKIAGAIDVIAALNSNAVDQWELVCAVHEVVPE
jgi:hypothetical protein